MKIPVLAILLSALALSAATSRPLTIQGKGVGFTKLPAEATGIRFTNYVPDIRSITNRNLLSGSGVAAGDVDGDGLVDLYFCGLENNNELYRNLGNWKFESITAKAGVALPKQDSTGAALVDIDGDGDLDLLVTGLGTGLQLFRNDGKGAFDSVTKEAGLQSGSGSTSMAVADVEGDGDLDIYLVNYRPESLKDMPDAKFRIEYVRGKPVITHFNGRPTTAPELTNRFVLAPSGEVMEMGEADVLYINDGTGRFSASTFTSGRFLDESGAPLNEPLMDWGLAALFYDFTGDGAPDLYVCNDFFSPDRIWINDGSGKFRAAAPLSVRSTSTFSMGVDFADIDRDGNLDFFVTDMLGVSHKARHVQVGEKMPYGSMPGVNEERLQKTHNTLQRNRGDATFAEIAWYAGVEASDWSWGPVFMDVDLDGWEDLLISNGNQYDVQNADVAQKIEQLKANQKLNHGEILRTLKMFPTLASRKLLFRNQKDGSFSEHGREWGFSDVGISQGMALADLDNDGDQDVVINNLFAPAGVYRNESTAGRVAVRLKGERGNRFGAGAKVRFVGGPVEQRQEMISAGRYLSSDEPLRVFATGKEFANGRIEVDWRDGKRSVVENVQANRVYEIAQASSEPASAKSEASAKWFEDVSHLLKHSHSEVPFDDFGRQPLLPYRLSQLGPGISWHDFDSDGWDDILIPSGRGGRFAIFRNNQKGGFALVEDQFLQRPVSRDQTTALGIGPLIFVGSANWEDGNTNGGAIRLYDTQRKAAGENLLGVESSTGPMALADVDGDGLLDLFVGGRAIAGKYPAPAASVVYRNEGNRFVAKQRFEALGLVSGATFSDIDHDNDPDLLLATHWGPPRVLLNANGEFTDETQRLGLAELSGLWNGIATGDFDNDGRLDFIASNWGQNSYWRATREHPLKLYFGDYDGNEVIDIIEARYDQEMNKEVPLRTLRSIGPALPWVMEQMRTFEAYANSSVQEIYGPKLSAGGVLQVRTLASTLFLNRGGSFESKILPPQAQFAPAFGVSVGDLDGDGDMDVFLSQNFFATNPEMARNDAGIGLVLKGDGKGNLAPIAGHISGIQVYGEQRGSALADFDHDGRLDLLVTQNGAPTRLFRNRIAAPGTSVRLAGNAAGLKLRVGNGPIQEVQAGSGYWSSDSMTKLVRRGAEVLRYTLPNGKTGEAALQPATKTVRIDSEGRATLE